MCVSVFVSVFVCMPSSVFVSIMGLSNLRIYILFSCLLVLCYSNGEQSEDFYEVDNFIISEKLGPYDSHYIRGEISCLDFLQRLPISCGMRILLYHCCVYVRMHAFSSVFMTSLV